MTSIAQPATQAIAATRAGDHEREATADCLGQALAQGYLDMTEYEDRLRGVFGAHTTGELKQLLADLPVHQLRRNDPRRRAARHAAARLSVRLHLLAYLLMVVIVLTVWLAVGTLRGRLVLLARVADPRCRHRRCCPCHSDPGSHRRKIGVMRFYWQHPEYRAELTDDRACRRLLEN